MGSCNRVKLDLAIAIGIQETRQVHIMYEMRRGYAEIDRVKCWCTKGRDYKGIELKFKPTKLINIMYVQKGCGYVGIE